MGCASSRARADAEDLRFALLKFRFDLSLASEQLAREHTLYHLQTQVDKQYGEIIVLRFKVNDAAAGVRVLLAERPRARVGLTDPTADAGFSNHDITCRH